MSRRAPSCPESRSVTRLRGTQELPTQSRWYGRRAKASGLPSQGTQTGTGRSRSARRPTGADVPDRRLVDDPALQYGAAKRAVLVGGAKGVEPLTPWLQRSWTTACDLALRR